LLLLRIIRHGLVIAGRYLQFRVRVPDRPGSLAALLADLAGADANVVDIEHVRTGATLPVNEVEIVVQLEAKGTAHCQELLSPARKGVRADLWLSPAAEMMADGEPVTGVVAREVCGSVSQPRERVGV